MFKSTMRASAAPGNRPRAGGIQARVRLTFLGTSAARPPARRGLPAIAARAHRDRLLVDCGEGTQRQMLRFGVGLGLDLVLLTHLHSDHCFGLPGLLDTLALESRTAPLAVAAPRETLGDVDRLVRAGGGWPPYPLELAGLGDGDRVFRDGYAIRAVATDHGPPSLAYVLEEPPKPGRVDVNRARRLGLEPGPALGRLQRGERVVAPSGRTIAPEEVLGAPRPGRRVAISGDTRPCRELIAASAGADLLVHEATFASAESARAQQTGHSTAAGAARVAREASVRHLALYHVSSRYPDPTPLAREAAEGFAGRVTLAQDGDVLEVALADARAPAT